jgi:hypothetical protein
LASEQTQATAATAEKVIKLLNYCASHPEAKLRYHASDMILNTHSDASYISKRESKSRAGGFFYLGINIAIKNKLTNGVILIISTILKHVMSSAAEAEIGSVFLNTKEAKFLRTTLEEMGHPQPPTPQHFKLTTPLLWFTVMIQLNKDAPVLWTCYFIGSRTESNKVSSMSIGARDTKIWPFTSQNIIRQHITRECERCIYTRVYDR